MEDLPDLPFEKILSYLSLKDRIRSRAVSRGWRKRIRISSFKVKTLCFSDRPRGLIVGKSRWVSGEFAQNFISSSRFHSFFNKFARSAFSTLERLHLCALRLHGGRAFAKTLNSLVRLKELGLFRIDLNARPGRRECELNLPVLNSIRLEQTYGIKKLILDTPRLRKIKLWCCYDLEVKLVHGESLERLLIDEMNRIEADKLRNVTHLYHGLEITFYSTSLSGLKHLKKIHLYNSANAREVFESKQLYDLPDLRVYLCGQLLNDSRDDRTISSFSEDYLLRLAENPSRLADEIPFYGGLPYSKVQRLAPESALGFLNRFTDLFAIRIDEPVQDIHRFLEFLKNFNIVSLSFDLDQPQDLFDRLPEHSALEDLTMLSAPSDLAFLFGLQTLNYLTIERRSIDAELIRSVLEGFEFLLLFNFRYLDESVGIQIKHTSNCSEFEVCIHVECNNLSDVNSVIQFIIEKTQKAIKAIDD